MKSRLVLSLALSVSLGFAASCRSDPSHPPSPPPPPPLPTEPSLPTPTPEPNPGTEEERTEATAPAFKPEAVADSRKDPAKPAASGSSLYDMAKRGEATLPSSAKQPAPKTSPPSKETSTAAAPAAQPSPAPTKPAATTTKVRVPSTDHVRVQLPAGLQATLDRDPRMQPWVNTAIKVADDCYARARQNNTSASGVIKVRLTLHDAQRPSAEVVSVPSALSSVVMCTTGGLLNVKMPLFTGKEGEQHLVSVHFQK